jgi:hypothetical protein
MMILKIFLLVWWTLSALYYIILLYKKPEPEPAEGHWLYRIDYRQLLSWEWLLILPFVAALIVGLFLKMAFVAIKKSRSSWKR